MLRGHMMPEWRDPAVKALSHGSIKSEPSYKYFSVQRHEFYVAVASVEWEILQEVWTSWIAWMLSGLSTELK
jgi:hypothetical protein